MSIANIVVAIARDLYHFGGRYSFQQFVAIKVIASSLKDSYILKITAALSLLTM